MEFIKEGTDLAMLTETAVLKLRVFKFHSVELFDVYKG